MHILSRQYRSEFLACPQLIRFEYASGLVGFEPTLLIKCSTLLLKYIVKGVRMQILFSRLNNHLMYGLRVYDDVKRPPIIWSVIEHDREKRAIQLLLNGEKCQIFLFNEICVNIAWSAFLLVFDAKPVFKMLQDCKIEPVDHSCIKDDAVKILDRIHTELEPVDVTIVDIPNVANWNPVKSHYITNNASASLIDIFDSNEGNQQERIGVWLTDNLHPRMVYHGPQIPKGKVFRELIDIFFSHEFGSILIESKALTILSRENLPNRTKLIGDISYHITKASNQLRGAMRRLKEGVIVTSKDGSVIDVERGLPMHGIILIPDLDLVEDRNAYGLAFIKDFMESTGGFIHILDPSELLRLVQAAETVASQSV